ncbi:toxin biosynthesis protein [Westerdykella ornata]|uniref:Toxin biosynthesis protein n=1 Tax=Westerdykella ornata TaxID=318751 RepID=A0A6A6JL30_WESOR|nr:toxin biosynthesis protein [Westerdykella ornata]KAF2276648.1 toxin biosynthesis protein [Westerdykella ornata]
MGTLTHIDLDTPNTKLRDPDSSIVPHVALYIVQIVALASPEFRGRRLLFSLTIIGLAVWTLTHPHFTNDFALAQPFNISWSFYLATLAKMLLNDAPERHYWRIDKPAKEATSYGAFGFKKLKWAIALMLNTRGIRWNYQVKNIPYQPKQMKTQFLISQVFQFVKNMVIGDLLLELGRRFFYTTPDGRVGEINSKYLSLMSGGLGWSFLKVLVFGSTPYFMMSMQYAQFAFLAVLLGFSQPEDWPPTFGRLRGTTTVRDFWGKYWHQQLRLFLTQYVDAFADYFNIPKGTNLSSYTKLYLAFLISGFFHGICSLMMPAPDNLSTTERSLGFFLFFIWQVAAITVEDFGQWIARNFTSGELQREGSAMRRWIGYAWLILVMWFGLPLVGDMCLRMRVGVENPLPFSISRGFVEEYIPIPPSITKY